MSMASELLRSRIALLSSHRFDILVEIALSFVLAVVSWILVERLFRNGPLRLTGRPLFAVAGAIMFISLGFCSLTVFGRLVAKGELHLAKGVGSTKQFVR